MHVRIALIGAGYWGRNLARNIHSNPRSELKTVCDADPGTALATAEKYNAKAASDLDDVLADRDIDAVVIATPSSLHPDHVMAAARAGKHIFVEKPMANSADDARAMAEAAEKAGVKLMVGFTFLYNNIVADIKDRIDSGDLGDIHYVYSRRLNLGKFRRDNDVVWTLAPHDISILNYWFNDKPKQVTARGLTYAHPQSGQVEVCFAQLDYNNNLSGNLHLSWLDPQKFREMVIVGSKKMLIYDDATPGRHIRIFDKRVDVTDNPRSSDSHDYVTRLRTGDIVIPNIQIEEPLAAEIEHFVDCIITGNDPLTDGRHGVAITQVMSAMSRSIETDGAVTAVQYD